MTPFYLIFNPAAQMPNRRHPTLASARAEAERLSVLEPAATFVVMEAVCYAEKCQWHDLKETVDA
jgi:hypothetical protein